MMVSVAAGKMKNLVANFAHSTCSRRFVEMNASRSLFQEWDQKLHGHHNIEGDCDEADHPAGIGVFGAFSFDEFCEMLCMGLRIEMDETDLMALFNEWHELMDSEKRKLGYEEGDVADFDDQVVKEQDEIVELKKEFEVCSLEVVAEGEKLDVKAKDAVNTKKRRSSVVLLTDKTITGKGSSVLIRPEKPLPKLTEATKRWKKAITKVKTNFFFQGFTKEDERFAREMEAGMGGIKFGESAFCQLLWNHKLFVPK